MSRAIALLGLAIGGGAVSFTVAAQTGHVAPESAVITVEQRTVRSHVGWIENRHTVALTAWSVASPLGSRRTRANLTTGGRRWLHLGEATGGPRPFHLEAVAFADGTFDGNLEALIDPAVQLTRRPGLLDAVTLSTSLGLIYDVVAIIENKRDVPLTAWVFDIYDNPVGAINEGRSSDQCSSLSDELGRGPIRPFERRALGLRASYEGPAEPLPRVVFTGALWSDGHFEGRPAWREEVVERRKRDADEADFWVPLLRQAATMPGDEGLAFLRARRDHRLSLNPHRTSATAENIERWARQATAGTITQFPVLFTGAAAILERQRRQCGV